MLIIVWYKELLHLWSADHDSVSKENIEFPGSDTNLIYFLLQFFTFAATAAFAFDTYLQYGSWRKAQFEMGSAYSATVTTTTTTTTQVEHFETY